MIQTNTPCRQCGEPMIGIGFARHFRIVCGNMGCRLFRECQGVRERGIDLTPIMASMPAPLAKTVSPPRGRPTSGKKARKKTVRRKGLVYARKTV